MLVAFQMLDGREKRWFPKVARAAANRLSSLTHGINFELPGHWSAEFASTDDALTVVRQTQGADVTITTVVFAAAHWQSLDSAVGDATEQLAAALLGIVPFKQAGELRRLFAGAGIPDSRQVSVSRKPAPDDPRFHAVIYFSAPDFELSGLHRLYDELDNALQSAGFGEVDGSGTGLGGHHLDVSLRMRDAGLRTVFGFVKKQGSERHVRVTDARTGELLCEDGVAE